MGLAIVQKLKRPGGLPQEIEEKKLKVNMSKDPMWIPKPPVLYGSDKLDMFKPYDPETAAYSSPPGSPSYIGSPSDSSSSGSVTVPSLLSSIRATPSVSSIASTESTSENNSGKKITPSTIKTPLQTILKTLFKGKETEPTTSSDGSSPKPVESPKKKPVLSKVSGSMVDPIVQQYGQKSKVKQVEEDEKEDDFDRPYDPEEEYDPSKGYKRFNPQITDSKTDDTALSDLVEDDIAYDPEDETIFEVFQSDAAVAKLPISTQSADAPPLPTPVSDSTPTSLKSSPASVVSTLPTGAVVVSAATLSEQQRMLEELNKQIEEQKRQLKEQEEVLRQQREAVGMFMAHFSVSDTLLSPPTKSVPVGQLPNVQCGVAESKPTDKSDNTKDNTVMKENSVVKPEAVKLEQTTVSDNLKDTTNKLTEQVGTQENVKDCEKYSSAGEIEDSDVAYDPEDESLFDEIQDDVFKGGSTKTGVASSRIGESTINKSASPNSHQSRRRRLSPKRRSRRERDQRSPSRRSQRRSRSHSRRHRDKDRHRRGERDRSRHRTRDLSEYPGHRRKDRVTSRHSQGRRRSSSSPRRKHSSSVSPKRYRGPPSQVIDKTQHRSGSYNAPETVKTTAASSSPSATGIKIEPEEHKPECNLVENPVKHSLALIQNVKTEVSEPSISQYDNQSRSSSSQEKKTSLQETWFQDKIESKIPLREIDPPLRDSPESPDPEPPFTKPFSSETVDCAKTENSEEQNSAQSQFVKDENDSVATSDQTISNLSIGLNIQGTGPNRDAVKHSLLPATSFQGTRNSPDLKDSEYSVTHTALMKKGLDTQHVMTNMSGPTQGIKNTPADCSERRVMQQAECLQGSMLNLIKNSIPNITDSQTIPGGSEIRNPVQGTKKPPLQVINQDLIRQSPDVMQHVVQIASNSEMAESRTQNETPNQFIRNQWSDRPLHGPKDPISAMQHHNPNRSGHADQAEQNLSYYRESAPFLKTDESRSQPKNLDSKLDIMKIQASFGGTQLEGGNSHPGTLGSTSRMGNETGQSTSFNVFRGDQTHSKYNESFSFAERGLGRMESQPFRGDADCSVPEGRDRPDISNPDWRGPGSFQISQNKGPIPRERHFGLNAPQSDSGDAQKGINREVTDPVRTGPFTQNDRTDLDSQESYEVGTQRFQYGHGNKGPSPNRQTLVHDVRAPRGSDFMGARTEIIPEVQSSRNETRRPVFSDVMGKGPEKKGPDNEVHGRREPVGPDFKRPGPEWIGPKSDNPVHDGSRAGGPDFMGQRLESRNFPERRGPSFPGPGIDRRGPNMEGPGNDWRGTGGPNFKGGPERRGSFMKGGEHHSRGPENLDFRRPGYNEGSSSNENTGYQSRGGGGAVFRGPALEGRCLAVQSPEPDRISEHPHFNEQRSDNRSTTLSGPIIHRRMTGGPDFSRPLNEMRGPAMDSQNSDWKGSQGPKKNWGPGSDRKGAHFEHAGSESIEQQQTRILPGLECSNPDNAHGGPHFRGNVTEGTSLNLEGSDHNRRGPNVQGPGSNMMGSALNRTGPGIPMTGRIGQQNDCPKVSNNRAPWAERVSPNPRRTNSRSPPRDSQFRFPEQGRTSSDMEGMQLNRNSAHHNDVEHNRFSRRPGNESRGPDCEGSIPDKQNPRGPSFREPTLVRPCPGMDSRKPDWRESSDCARARGPREEMANTGLGYDGQNDWGESEPVQEFADYEGVESDRRGRSFRPSRLLRRNIRRPGPNARGFAPSRRGGGFEGKWSDRRGPRFEEFEGESSRDVWENSADRALDTYQDFPDEQGEDLHSHDNSSEWRDPQEEENAHFSVSGDDWDGPNREEQQHEWTEPDREGPGAFFRGRGGPCSRRQSWGRVRGRGRGSVQQRHVGMEDDWRQHDFKEDIGDHDGSTPWAHRGGFPTRRPTRRPFQMGAPGGPNSRCPESAYRNFQNDGPESDGRVSDFRESGSERHSADMDDQETEAKGFDHEFRRVRKGPIMRHQGPSNTEKRGVSPHGSDFAHPRWDANSEFPESDRRGPDRREREQMDQGQTTSRGRRGSGPREGPPAPFNRPVGPSPNREGKSFRDFDSPQNLQAVHPQKRRGGLLPTPSDGTLPLSNPMMKNNDGPSMKTPQFGPPCNRNRGTSRGRPVDSWFRGRARGQVRGAPAR